MPIQIGGFDWGQYGQQANQAAQLDLAKRAQAFSQYMQQANLDMERQRLNQALQQKMASQQYPVTGAGRSLPVGFDNMLMGNAAASRVPLPDEQEMRIAMPAQNIGMAEIRPTISPDTKKSWLKRQEMDYEDKLAEPQRQQKAKQWAEEMGLKERQTQIHAGQLKRQMEKDEEAEKTNKLKFDLKAEIERAKLGISGRALDLKEKRLSDLNSQFKQSFDQHKEEISKKYQLAIDNAKDEREAKAAALEWQKQAKEIDSLDKAIGRAHQMALADKYIAPQLLKIESDRSNQSMMNVVRIVTAQIQSGAKDEEEITKLFKYAVGQVGAMMETPGNKPNAPPAPTAPSVPESPTAFQSVMGNRSRGQAPQTPVYTPAQEDISIGQRGTLAPTTKNTSPAHLMDQQETDFNDEMLLQRFVSMPKTERKAAYNKLTAAQKIRVNRALGG